MHRRAALGLDTCRVVASTTSERDRPGRPAPHARDPDPVETRHVAFWQKFLGLEHVTRLDLGRRLRLALIVGACRLFGASAIHIVLEAIVLTGGAMIVAFISGMDVRRRIALNVVITGLAVVVTYVLGLLTKRLLGAEI